MVHSVLVALSIISFSVWTKADVKYAVNYPVKLLQPVTGTSFSGELSKDHLTCFGNQDFKPATFLEGIYCMSGAPWVYPLFSCESLWGSRSVYVSVQGSIEFFRMEKLPRESSHTLLNASHWLHLDSSRDVYSNEILHIDTAPVYLCARSNDWRPQFNTSQFSLQFRPAFIREKHRVAAMRTMLSEMLFLLGMCFPWLYPVLKAGVVASYVFSYGLNFFIAIVSSSTAIVLLTPFVLTRKNRDHIRFSYKLYFSVVKPAGEIELDYRRAWLVFHAVYFSSLIVCGGCTLTYACFVYFGLDGELRNDLLRASLATAAAAMVYFASRVFDRSSHFLSFGAAVWATSSTVRTMINKRSRDEVTVAILLISLVVQSLLKKLLAVPQITRICDVIHQEMVSFRVDLFGRVFNGSPFVSPELAPPRFLSVNKRPIKSLDFEKNDTTSSRLSTDICKTFTVEREYTLLGPLVFDNEYALYIPFKVECKHRALVQAFLANCQVRHMFALCESNMDTTTVSSRQLGSLLPPEKTNGSKGKVSAMGRNSRRSKRNTKQMPSAVSPVTSVSTRYFDDRYKLVLTLPDLSSVEECLIAMKTDKLFFSEGNASLPAPITSFISDAAHARLCETGVQLKGVYLDSVLGLDLSFIVDVRKASTGDENGHEDLADDCVCHRVGSTLKTSLAGLNRAELVAENKIVTRKWLPRLEVIDPCAAIGVCGQMVFFGTLNGDYEENLSCGLSNLIAKNNYIRRKGMGSVGMSGGASWRATITLAVERSCDVVGISDGLLEAVVCAANTLEVYLEHEQRAPFLSEKTASSDKTTQTQCIPLLHFVCAVDMKAISALIMQLSDEDVKTVVSSAKKLNISDLELSNRFQVSQYLMHLITGILFTAYMFSLMVKKWS